ncbi:MAG: nitrite reductase/ring-hydroxylating ferredoxin subunit [Planctomycetota bacterium]|jgi:nitrite reductase/ring-hydroxylating ferredoxin subunit
MSNEENNDTSLQWFPVSPIEAIEPGSLTTVKKADKQIVLIRHDDGRFFALDNKCPHEGYALAQGDLKDCKLTCCWHNWKFDITNGSCLVGGEGVRSYAVREADGQVQIDLSDPDPESLYPALFESLDEGIFKHENDRAARDGIRLLQLGYPADQLLARIAHYDALHAEYGTSHALPVAADCGRFLSRLDGPEAMYAIIHAIDMCGDENSRIAPRQRPAPKPNGNLNSIRQAAEQEDASEAEALLLGAIDSGTSRSEIESWLHVIISDHFTGFGHPLIYLVKAKELLDRVGDEWMRDIYGSLLYRYILSTREDTLPYMKVYRGSMESMEDELGAVFTKQSTTTPFDEREFASTILDGAPHEASQALTTALTSGVDNDRIARALVLAGATRMLRFDPKVEKDPSVAETWVWVTHRFTHACAVHQIAQRHPSPDSIRYLFHAVAFINSGKRMDTPAADRVEIKLVPGTIDDFVSSLHARNEQMAIGLALSLLQTDDGFQALRIVLEDLSIQDVVIRPIVVAHLIKTTIAAVETYETHADFAAQDVGMLAIVRFLCLGIKERRVHDMVTASIGWIVDGKIPKKLTQ